MNTFKIILTGISTGSSPRWSWVSSNWQLTLTVTVSIHGVYGGEPNVGAERTAGAGSEEPKSNLTRDPCSYCFSRNWQSPEEPGSQGEDGGLRTLVSTQVAHRFESSLLVGAHIPIGHLLDRSYSFLSPTHPKISFLSIHIQHHGLSLLSKTKTEAKENTRRNWVPFVLAYS